ncbi:ATP-binding protein [Neobacillus sp. 179-C4.2 HS]|uniref:histidine kinase n=1 Tax=Neobacillus driksii TaxID=3035913 RepID=A0ABV4Z1H7_9BACI|nr:ATP-binding protein [Neobacillus sp. 179.-C4.2 HS]MDP5195294.1 ATP-binding protein [Neobacillus sp. 179.-C4.2 HS]
MKTNLLSFFHLLTNLGEKDVFKSTQGRLTRIYSGLLILFLILFIMIVYSVLYFSILRNQETELETLVKQEAGFLEDYLTTNEKSDFRGIENQEVVFAGVNQLFYYVVNSNGEMIMGNEADQRLRSAVLNSLNRRGLHEGEILKETLHLEGNGKGRGKPGEFFQREPDRDIRLIIASQSIYDNGHFVGKLFIGKDITFAYQLFHWLLIILLIIGFVFVGVALFISAAMSKKAMIPISRAFTRQREFVGDASHELRTPLSVLLSSLDAIEMTIDTKKEEFAGKLLSNMRQEVKRMTSLVSDLLTLARSDSNIIERRSETFDFLPHAEKAIESVESLANAKQINLHFDAPDTLMAKGDPERLSQLLYILLDNAIKYTPNQGEVWLLLSREGQELCIRVKDTGIGIKKEDFHRVFERFYRADKSRSRQMGGHGLGLSIAKWIVETHEGTINISSEIGKGTEFTIRIPLKK